MLFEKQEYDEAILEYTEVLGVLPPRPRAQEDVNGKEESSQKGKEVILEAASVSVNEEEEDEEGYLEKIRLLRSVIFANLAACHLKKKDFKEAVMACNESLLDDSLYLKALNRRAQANEEIGTWSSLTSSLEGKRHCCNSCRQQHHHSHFLSLSLSLTDYKTMNAMPHPDSLQSSITSALQRIPPKITITSEREKEEMMGKLKGLGDSVLGYFGLSTNNFQFQKGDGGGYNLNFVR